MPDSLRIVVKELDPAVRAWLAQVAARELADDDEVLFTIRPAAPLLPGTVDESARLAPEVQVQAAIAEAIELGRSPNF